MPKRVQTATPQIQTTPVDPQANMKRLATKQNDLTLQSLSLHAKEARTAFKRGDVVACKKMLEAVKAYLGMIRFPD